VRIASSHTRHEAPKAAAEAVERLARRMVPEACAICFKKVDSTLRGHVARETKAMMRAGGFEYAVLAPALPAQGRTISSGLLHVRDCTDSWTADARGLLSQQGLKKVALLSNEVTAPAEKIAQEILRLRAIGAEFILCDTQTDQDLDRIAQALHQLPQRPLWVGSAGLAKSAAQVLVGVDRPGRKARVRNASERRPDHRPAPILFCVGSDHPVTLLQIQCLEESGAADVLEAEAATPEQVRRIFRQGHHLLLRLHGADADRERIRLLIAEARSGGIAAAFLTGGNTAEFVCNAIGTAAILLEDEVSPGIPWGIFRGGLLDRLPVATKAGGFGGERALLNAAEFLGAIELGPA
jgi:uncharacterized protein YgbK (DUF1537 family)